VYNDSKIIQKKVLEKEVWFLIHQLIKTFNIKDNPKNPLDLEKTIIITKILPEKDVACKEMAY